MKDTITAETAGNTSGVSRNSSGPASDTSLPSLPKTPADASTPKTGAETRGKLFPDNDEIYVPSVDDVQPAASRVRSKLFDNEQVQDDDGLGPEVASARLVSDDEDDQQQHRKAPAVLGTSISSDNEYQEKNTKRARKKIQPKKRRPIKEFSSDSSDPPEIDADLDKTLQRIISSDED